VHILTDYYNVVERMKNSWDILESNLFYLTLSKTLQYYIV